MGMPEGANCQHTLNPKPYVLLGSGCLHTALAHGSLSKQQAPCATILYGLPSLRLLVKARLGYRFQRLGQSAGMIYGDFVESLWVPRYLRISYIYRRGIVFSDSGYGDTVLKVQAVRHVPLIGLGLLICLVSRGPAWWMCWRIDVGLHPFCEDGPCMIRKGSDCMSAAYCLR